MPQKKHSSRVGPETDSEKEVAYEQLLDLIARLLSRRWLETQGAKPQGAKPKKSAETRRSD